jgi:hypothetical protein
MRRETSVGIRIGVEFVMSGVHANATFCFFFTDSSTRFYLSTDPGGGLPVMSSPSLFRSSERHLLARQSIARIDL